MVSKSAYLLFYRRREPRYLGPPALQHMVQEAMETSSSDDEESEDAGKDQTGDSTSSGSSDDSGPRGTRSRGIRLRGSGADDQLPSYSDATQDEGISMEEDPIESREGGATPPDIHKTRLSQSWGFANLGKSSPTAPASSETAGSRAGSPDSTAPNVNDHDLEDREMTEFGDIDQVPLTGQMAEMPPIDDTVTEVHLSDNDDQKP